jgi:hypothetical protein
MSLAPSLSLHLDFPKILVAGAGSRFSACVTNIGTEPLHNVAVTFACEDFDPPELTLEMDDLQPGGRQERAVSVLPTQVGNRPLSCTVEFTQGTQTQNLYGTWEGLTIFERPSSQVSITNIVQDVQSHRSSGDKAEFGAVKGDVSINLSNNLSQIQSLNDLLAITLPPAWHQVPLRSLTSTVIRRANDRRRIPAAFLRVYEPMTALHIRPLGAPPPSSSDPTPYGWRLRAGTSSQLVLGRSSSDADLVTRFMPAESANDHKSAGLSRKQARFSVNAAGQLAVENISSGNVVIVGRTALPAGGASLLAGDQSLSLGTPPADLRLHARLAPAPAHSIRVANLEEWQGHGPSRHLPPEPEANWGHLLLDWLNSAPSFWQTVWFSRLAAFGTSAEVPLRLEDPDLDPCHGFLHYFCGCYWLEVISQRGGVALHDPQNPDANAQVAVPPGVIVPLRANMTLTLGSSSFLLTKAA